MSERSLHTRRIVLSALFLAIALVLRTFFRMYIPLMGESGMRLSIHGIFSIMPSILFGPLYGAMTSGLTDMVGHFLSPSGAWIPWLTLTAVLGGFTRGWLWLLLKYRSARWMRITLASTGALLIAFGGYNMLAFRADGVTRGFYTRTPAQREAWDAGYADAYGVFWSIDSTRTEHIHADGDTYWRVREDVWAIRGLAPGAPAHPDMPDTLDFRGNAVWRTLFGPQREGHRAWSLSGTRVITERYGYDSEGVWRILRTVDIPASSLHMHRADELNRITRMAFERSFYVVGQTTQLTDFISMMTIAPMGAGAFFFLLLLVDLIVRRVLARRAEGGKDPLPHTMALILAMMIPAILVSSVNTFILSRTVFTSWQLLPFVVVWLPRVLQSMATTTINVFFVALMVNLCEKQPTLRALIRK